MLAFLLFQQGGIKFVNTVWADAMADYDVEVMDQKVFQVNPGAFVIFYAFTGRTHGPENIGNVFMEVFSFALKVFQTIIKLVHFQ